MVDGIRYWVYYISSNAKKASVSSLEGSDQYVGSINIPESISYGGIDYPVTEIGYNAFFDCKGLTSVTIPNSVTKIDVGAFTGCIGLKSINIPNSVTSIGRSAFRGCEGLMSVKIPNTVTSIGGGAFSGCTGMTQITLADGNEQYYTDGHSIFSRKDGQVFLVSFAVQTQSYNIPDTVVRIEECAFYGCTGLTSVNIPSSVKSIGESAFERCEGLTSITIPNSVKNIGESAFEFCTGLTNVNIPSSVTSINPSTFKYCSDLKSVSIPNSVTSIGDEAFYYCDGLSSINIPSSVTSIGSSVFFYANISKIKIYTRYTNMWDKIFDGLNADTIYAYSQQIQSISKACPYAKVFDWNDYWGVAAQSRSFSIETHKNEEYRPEGNEDGTKRYFILNETEVQPVERNGRYVFLGLNPSQEYTFSMGLYNSEKNEWIGSPTTLDIQTSSLLKRDNGKSTQTTFLTNIILKVDSNYRDKPSLCELELCDRFGNKIETRKLEYVVEKQQVVKFTGLIPNEKYRLYYADNLVNGNRQKFQILDTYTSTKGISPYIDAQTVGVTTATIKVTANTGDATIAESYWVLPDYLGGNQTGDVLELNGLNPNSTYTFTYVVKTKEGNKTFQARKEVRTSSLELVTEPKAKATSNSVALICANTNIDNSEVNTGFEWRRYDAPDLVPSEQAACPVIDGVMTGALKNLSASTYYKFRPFYKARSGQMYYGEWSAFGTADAYVYFDPTVRTYAAVVLNSKSIQVKGYAIAGSDEIIEQGFEYWKTGSAKVAKRILANSTTDSTTDEGKQTIAATGQWMSATIEGLTPATTYAVRAFVRTAKGTTYGEEQTFTTPVASGIELPTTQEGKLSVSLIRANAGTLNFSVTGADNSAKWKLYSVSGTMVAGGNVNSENEVQQANLPQLTPGVYLLNVSDQDDACSLRIIIR